MSRAIQCDGCAVVAHPAPRHGLNQAFQGPTYAQALAYDQAQPPPAWVTADSDRFVGRHYCPSCWDNAEKAIRACTLQATP